MYINSTNIKHQLFIFTLYAPFKLKVILYFFQMPASSNGFNDIVCDTHINCCQVGGT